MTLMAKNDLLENEREKRIIETSKNINDYFSEINIDNKTYVFDLGNYIKLNKDKSNSDAEWRYGGYLFGHKEGVKSYYELLNVDNANNYQYFNENCKLIVNLSESGNKFDSSKPTEIEPVLKPAIKMSGAFNIRAWKEELSNKGVKGCLLIDAKELKQHQSAIWLVLNERINGLKDDVICVGTKAECRRCKGKKNGFECINDIKNETLANIVRDVFEELDELLIKELVYNTEAYSNELLEKIELTAVRAAISQVMARNLSHNIGSHVLNNLIDGKALVDEKLQEKLKGLYDGIKNIDLLPNNQLAYFNNYIKNRMDYLSEVTFGTSTMQTSKKIYAEVYKELDQVRLLLNHISGISGFYYEICFKYEGNPISEKDEKDISVSFPADVLGCQAFYNILENIIRNTAKHCQDKEEGIDVTFSIDFKELKEIYNEIENVESYYCVEISDSIPIKGYIDISNISDEDKRSYYKYKYNIKNWTDENENEYITYSWNDITRAEWLVANQNIKLNQSVLTENYQLRTNSLGLLEMEASAAFLRKINLPEIESDDYEILYGDAFCNTKSKKLNIIKAFLTENDCLGYRIFLIKPQEFLFVGNWQLGKNEVGDSEIKQQLLKHGISFDAEKGLDSEKEFLRKLKKGTIYNHQFVIYKNIECPELTSLFDYNRNKEIDNLVLKTALPKRIINADDKSRDIINLLKNGNLKELEEKVWKIWISQIPENSFIVLLSSRPTLENNQVILFNHLTSRKLWDDQCDNKKRFQDENNKLKMWLEPLSGNAQKKLPEFEKISKKYPSDEALSRYIHERDALSHLKIFESYLNKVLVIDERIQRFSSNEYLHGVKNFEIFESSNVCIPRIENIDLCSKNFAPEIINNILEYIDMQKEDSCFLLIHYGILERMYKNSDEKKISEKLETWARSMNVIVTSGRGKQSLNLPHSVCYVNLSSVLYAFVENRNKYSINYLLNQSRR